MFGTNLDPRRPPMSLIEALKSRSKPSSKTIPNFVDELAIKTSSLLIKWEEAARNQQAHLNSIFKPSPLPPSFNEGDVVLRLAENSKRLHGARRGPFQIVKTYPKT
ncbi:hypothetical protein GEMRC1_011235 [Eukaryota sp. GEM-RC1]